MSHSFVRGPLGATSLKQVNCSNILIFVIYPKFTAQDSRVAFKLNKLIKVILVLQFKTNSMSDLQTFGTESRSHSPGRGADSGNPTTGKTTLGPNVASVTNPVKLTDTASLPVDLTKDDNVDSERLLNSY